LSGDIGITGKGNRPNGLITANRPMSTEGVSGKNPRYYSGFIYSILSMRIAEKLYSRTKKPCEVKIVSQNGGDLLRPWKTFIIINSDDTNLINKIVKGEFKKISKLVK